MEPAAEIEAPGDLESFQEQLLPNNCSKNKGFSIDLGLIEEVQQDEQVWLAEIG